MTPKDKLAAARLKAAQAMPYFRAAITGLVPKEAPGLGTFGVTKHGVMLWDPACLERWSVDETATVLVHEVSHLLRDHNGRCERIAGEHQMWNIAGDLEINDDIVAAGMTLPGGQDEGVYPSTFNLDDGLTAEEYYRELDKLPKRKITVVVAGGEGSGDGEGEDGDGQGKNKDGAVGRGKCGGCAGNPGEDEDEVDGKSGRSDVEIERIKRTVAEAIHKEAASGRGTVPAGWQRWANQQLQPPKIPWRQKLARAVRGAVAYRPGAVDLHYTRPSRRQAGVGFGPGKPVLPALRAPIPKVSVIVDTSGSMGDQELLEAVSETRGVLDACGAGVTFCACDAEVHELREVRHWKDVVGLLKGGGGTNFIPAFEALEKRRPRPDVVIFVTDGCGPAPVEPPPYKVIWVLVGPYKQMPYAGDGEVTWGEAILIEGDAAVEAA